ncbi:MAG: SH3 domain-containing protein [Caldilineaceae bacterium]
MHPQPRRILQSLLRQYGPGLMADSQRTEALLSDLCGVYETEIFVLVHAQRAGILGDLVRLSGQRAESALRQRLARRLQDRYAFSAEAAAWAVDAWADALNVHAVPIYQSWLLGFWHSLRKGATELLHPQPASRAPAFRATAHRGESRRSFFGRIGVQWRRASTGILLLAVVVAAVAVAWQSGWLDRASEVALGSNDSPVVESWQPPSPAGAATALAEGFPPPQAARIEADLLNVRAAPDLNGEVLGKVGPLGAAVTVDGFNEDGSWSHIAAPVAGWISNEFVTFAGLYLRPGLGQVIQAGSVVRSEPHRDAPAIDTLVAGQTLVFVALSADGQWRQVVEPSPGWVESRYIEVMER